MFGRACCVSFKMTYITYINIGLVCFYLAFMSLSISILFQISTSSTGKFPEHTLAPFYWNVSTRSRQSGCHFADDIFKCILLYKTNVFWLNFPDVCSQRSYCWWVSIGSGNGLVPDRWQAIMWTNDDIVSWRTHALLGICKLMRQNKLCIYLWHTL